MDGEEGESAYRLLLGRGPRVGRRVLLRTRVLLPPPLSPLLLLLLECRLFPTIPRHGLGPLLSSHLLGRVNGWVGG